MSVFYVRWPAPYILPAPILRASISTRPRGDVPLTYFYLVLAALRGETENTPLQLKLNNLAELIATLGSIAGLALFIALMIRFFVQLGTNNPERTANQKGIAFVNILIISVTLIVVAVPEGVFWPNNWGHFEI